MRKYEIVIILTPNLDERKIEQHVDSTLEIIRKDRGTVDKLDIWGKRQLSYEIAKHKEGIYAIINVNATPASVAELDRQLSLNETVLRTKIIKI